MLNNIEIKVVSQSSNKKTGAITQTYSSSNTCPSRCPFKNSGCYASSGPCGLVWKKMQNSIKPQDLKAYLENIPTTKLLRHNVAGDIAIEGTSQVNGELLKVLTEAYKGHNAYTYTHCELNQDNASLIKEACNKGFIINISCENLEQVKLARVLGLPCVLTCESFEGTSKTIDKIRFVKCPSYKEGVTCASCQMCAKARNFVVVFEAHGTSKKKAIKSGNLLSL